MKRAVFFLTLLPILLFFGCKVGEAQFEGNLSGKNFDPSGTVFSYMNSNNQLVVMMTWIAFDPKKDLQEQSSSAVNDIKKEFAAHDALLLYFDSTQDIKAEAHFQTNEILSYKLQIGDGQTLGSQQSIDVTIDNVDLAASQNPFISGHIDLWIKKAETDPSAALEGHLRGSFTAPLIREPVATKNASTLIPTPPPKRRLK